MAALGWLRIIIGVERFSTYESRVSVPSLVLTITYKYQHCASLTASISTNDFEQVVHTFASVAKQYNLVAVFLTFSFLVFKHLAK